MIKKLIPDHILGLDGLPTTIMPDSAKLMRKINELIDVVNTLVEENNVHEKQIDELQMKEPADPFAEQRKWIGKLCRFWDDYGEEDKVIDVLSHIDTSGRYVYVMCDHQVHYQHCEPVKPDDDIIYKGE